MSDAKSEFAQRLSAAMQVAGYKPMPSILEREFNLRSLGARHLAAQCAPLVVGGNAVIGFIPFAARMISPFRLALSRP